jgi:hypothetical protein
LIVEGRRKKEEATGNRQQGIRKNAGAASFWVLWL